MSVPAGWNADEVAKFRARLREIGINLTDAQVLPLLMAIGANPSNNSDTMVSLFMSWGAANVENIPGLRSGNSPVPPGQTGSPPTRLTGTGEIIAPSLAPTPTEPPSMRGSTAQDGLAADDVAGFRKFLERTMDRKISDAEFKGILVAIGATGSDSQGDLEAKFQRWMSQAGRYNEDVSGADAYMAGLNANRRATGTPTPGPNGEPPSTPAPNVTPRSTGTPNMNTPTATPTVGSTVSPTATATPAITSTRTPSSSGGSFGDPMGMDRPGTYPTRTTDPMAMDLPGTYPTRTTDPMAMDLPGTYPTRTTDPMAMDRPGTYPTRTTDPMVMDRDPGVFGQPRANDPMAMDRDPGVVGQSRANDPMAMDRDPGVLGTSATASDDGIMIGRDRYSAAGIPNVFASNEAITSAILQGFGYGDNPTMNAMLAPYQQYAQDMALLLGNGNLVDEADYQQMADNAVAMFNAQLGAGYKPEDIAGAFFSMILDPEDPRRGEYVNLAPALQLEETMSAIRLMFVNGNPTMLRSMENFVKYQFNQYLVEMGQTGAAIMSFPEWLLKNTAVGDMVAPYLK